MAICGIVGSSGAGKTRLVQHLVPALAGEGLRVGYVKHAAHGFDAHGFEHGGGLDRPGSDSTRVRDAGAREVLLVGPEVTLRMGGRRDDLASPAMLAALHDSDVMLVEGFSSSQLPKIRVRVAGQGPRAVADPVLLDLERRGDDWDEPDVARATETVLGLVEVSSEPAVSVIADGQQIPVAGFAARAVAASVLGITSALRGVDDPDTLTVTVRLPRGGARP